MLGDGKRKRVTDFESEQPTHKDKAALKYVNRNEFRNGLLSVRARFACAMLVFRIQIQVLVELKSIKNIVGL